MTADVLAVDLQVVVGRATDDETAGRQLALRDRLAVEADQDAAERDAPLTRRLRRWRVCERVPVRERLQLDRALRVLDPLQFVDRRLHVLDLDDVAILRE